jgi:hypothetical protein
MTVRHYAFYLDKASTALSLAVSGHAAGFVAFVEAEKVDLREVEMFYSRSDANFGQTLMLVYEVVKQSNLSLLQYLLDVVGLSVTVREDWIHNQIEAAKRIERSNRNPSATVDRDDGLRLLMIANPYHCKTLLEFAEQEVVRRHSQLTKVETELAAVTAMQPTLESASPRAPEATDEELDNYFRDRLDHHITRAWMPTEGMSQETEAPPSDREDFNNELDYRRANQRRAMLTDKYADLIKKHDEAVKIVDYLKNRPV